MTTRRIKIRLARNTRGFQAQQKIRRRARNGFALRKKIAATILKAKMTMPIWRIMEDRKGSVDARNAAVGIEKFAARIWMMRENFRAVKWRDMAILLRSAIRQGGNLCENN